MLSGVFPILLLLVMGAAWGLQFAMLKLAVQSGYSELNVLLLALSLITVIYGVLLAIKRNFFRLNIDRFLFFVITAAIGYLLPMGATLLAAPHIPAGILVLIASLAPLFTFTVAIGLRTENVSSIRIWAVILASIATLLVLLPEAELPGRGAFGWMVLALVIPLCYGVESIYVAAKWPSGLNVTQVGFGEALAALIMVLPLYGLFGEPGSLDLGWSTAVMAVVVFVVCGVFEIFMYFYLVRTTGGVLVSFATFISLFAGIGWGMLIFDEVHRLATWFAVMILVLSLALVSLDQARQIKRRDE